MVYITAKRKWRQLLKNCGTGSGGFKPGNRCARGGDGESGDVPSKETNGNKSRDKVNPKVLDWAKRKWGDDLAPNGKTKAENFAAWFGDSKVVNENGEPLVVYHGTVQGFDEFNQARVGELDRGLNGRGFYFAANPDYASNYASRGGDVTGGNVIPAYLSLKNPLQLHKIPKTEANQWDAEFRKDPIAAREKMERMGYDGVIASDPIKNKRWAELVAFESSQIKSATGNDGNFDPSNNSIRKRHRQKLAKQIWVDVLKNCGTGSGGFKPGNRCARGDDGDTSDSNLATQNEKDDVSKVAEQLNDIAQEIDSRASVSFVDTIPGNAFSLGNADLETGKIQIVERIVPELASFFDGDRSSEATQAVHVLVHEAFHVNGKLSESARVMQVVAIEEATTEILSREYMQNKFNIKDKVVPKGTKHRFGAYQRVISSGVAELANQTGLSYDDAGNRMIEASKKWRQRDNLNDYRTALFSFIDDLGVDRRAGISVVEKMDEAYHGRKGLPYDENSSLLKRLRLRVKFNEAR